ncbi:Os06g0274875, partial [Oryza sativa Japonica Group]
VDKSAVLPDLTTCRVGDVAHLDHGVGELLEEGVGVGPVLADGVGRGVAEDAGPHLLVGVEEALAVDEGPEVGVVEGGGGVAVHGADVVVAAVQGADVLELAQVGLGDRAVLGRHLVVAVDPVPEVGAPGESDCVGS